TLIKNICSFNLSDALQDCSNEKSQYQFFLKCLHNEVVILYPSFCTPLIITPSDNIWMIILADKGFYETFANDPDTNKTIGGPQIRRVINSFLVAIGKYISCLFDRLSIIK
ncbi:hypothetical protein MHK_008956, partial [Candidatus Magnetomorum sp. HK-1]